MLENVAARDIRKKIDLAFRRPDFIPFHRTGYTIFRTGGKTKMKMFDPLGKMCVRSHTYTAISFLLGFLSPSSQVILFNNKSDGVDLFNAVFFRWLVALRVTAESYRYPSSTAQYTPNPDPPRYLVPRLPPAGEGCSGHW